MSGTEDGGRKGALGETGDGGELGGGREETYGDEEHDNGNRPSRKTIMIEINRQGQSEDYHQHPTRKFKGKESLTDNPKNKLKESQKVQHLVNRQKRAIPELDLPGQASSQCLYTRVTSTRRHQGCL